MKNAIITVLVAISILYVVIVTAFVFACILAQANPLSVYWDITRFEGIAPIYWGIAYVGAFNLSLHVIKAD